MARRCLTLVVRPDRVSNRFTIVAVDPDPDYLGIEIFASSRRFSGTTRIYAGLDELSRFAGAIEGFPTSREDERRHVFGTQDKGIAGGYCSVRFRCRDTVCHSVVEFEFEDDDAYYSEGAARFSFSVEPAEIDAFVRQLRLVEQTRSGEAKIENEG